MLQLGGEVEDGAEERPEAGVVGDAIAATVLVEQIAALLASLDLRNKREVVVLRGEAFNALGDKKRGEMRT